MCCGISQDLAWFDKKRSLDLAKNCEYVCEQNLWLVLHLDKQKLGLKALAYKLWLYFMNSAHYIGSMYCVLRNNHAKFAKETSANFRNIQH